MTNKHQKHVIFDTIVTILLLNKKISITNNRLFMILQKSFSNMPMQPNKSQEDIDIILNLPNNILSKRVCPKHIEDVTKSILFQSENYIVINKPYDVRMDGDFSVTIEKLLLSWLKDDNISLDSIKFVHQLDYATSGCLCIGKNKDAAAIASQSFENRVTEKEYLAILQGKLEPNNYPLLNKRPKEISYNKKPKNNDNFNKWNEKNKRSKLNQNNNNNDNNNNNNNSNSNNNNNNNEVKSTLTWQDEAMRNGLKDDYFSLQDLIKKNINNKLDEQLITMSTYSFEQLCLNSKLRKKLRKILKSNGIINNKLNPTKDNFYDSNIHISTETETKYYSRDMTNGLILPDDAIYRIIEDNVEKLIISMPVAVLPNGDFRMEPGHELNPGKICQTEVEVIEYLSYQDEIVTKVKFHPITGRRHQLRIHSVCLNHPIVGDTTYNSHPLTNITTRMMLHAYKLKIPLAIGYHEFLEKPSSTFINISKLIDNINNKDDYNKYIGKDIVNVVSIDPFPSNNGNLIII
jgi:23S rRNA-/tRNA-specific pseudouridylate synthase